LDEEDLLPGQLWEQEIPKALKTSDFILIFFSQNSASKHGYMQRELKLALAAWQEVPEGMIHTIPVRLDNCEVPEQFGRSQRADLFVERGVERLVTAIRTGLSQRQQHRAPRLTNSISMEFVLIDAGTFQMGAADGWELERLVHSVCISLPFYLGKYPVTQAQWATVLGNNPSAFKGHPDWPVESVSWEHVQEFIQKLNARESNEYYRLPTEAEWEYACRAGSTTVYCFGDNSSQLGEYAWYRENAGGQPHPVGLLKPNAWGLYDMHGNVWEWVQDWCGPYVAEAVPNPPGAASGVDRVNRGGSWVFDDRFCRSAARGHVTPDHRAYDLGFRLLKTVL
jgi:formylglycine-generating enzyme required for sulfatase activity